MSDVFTAAGSDRTRVQPFAIRVLVFPVVLAVCWIAAAQWLPYAVASPAQTFDSIMQGVDRGWMRSELATTMTATFLSFVISTVAGVAFSVAIALNKFWGDVWEPVLVWLYSVPKIVLYPIVLMLFGLSLSASVAFGVLNSVLPVAIIVFGTIRAVPAIYLKVSQSYRLTRWESFKEVVMPVAAPSIVTAGRYAFSLSFLAVVVAEMLGSRQGIGQELFRAIALNDIGKIFGIALVLSIIAVLVNAVFLLLQNVLFERDRFSARENSTKPVEVDRRQVQPSVQ